MIFIHFPHVVYHFDWFVDVELFFNSCNKIYLIVVYDPFTVLLNLVYYYFVEDFCIYVKQEYVLVIFFLALSSDFGIKVMLALWDESGIVPSCSIIRRIWEEMVLILL